jgi:hypothetical protein
VTAIEAADDLLSEVRKRKRKEKERRAALEELPKAPSCRTLVSKFFRVLQ